MTREVTSRRGSVVQCYRENDRVVELRLHQRSLRYLNEFVQMRCGLDLHRAGLFPNAKEVTESFGAFSAVMRHLGAEFPLADPSISLFAVGDGVTPRTAATFAFRSRWQCHSIDPQLRDKKEWQAIERLILVPRRVEDYRWSGEKAVIVAVHSHANFATVLKSIQAVKRAVVAIPCCGVPHEIPNRPPTFVYDDWGIWSRQREVRVWTSV